MSVLAEKLKKAREVRVEAGGFTFIVRRPTDVEWLDLSGKSTARAVIPFVVGWEGVKELDLIPGGDPHPLAFDPLVCQEWLADRIDLLPALADAMVSAYVQHVEKLGVAEKN